MRSRSSAFIILFAGLFSIFLGLTGAYHLYLGDIKPVPLRHKLLNSTAAPMPPPSPPAEPPVCEDDPGW